MFGLDLLGDLAPWLVGVVGVIWAMIAGNGKATEKERRKVAEHTALAEQARAEIAEETTKVIIKQEKIADVKVNEAREEARVRRGRFTSQLADN
jgi:hypothetical protein